MALNKIVLMGRITRDIDLRRTDSGKAVTSFSIACERDMKGQNGERETDFIDVVAWGNTAEFVSKFFGKGRMIAVEGRLQIREWTDKDGHKRRNAEVIANSVYFADSKTEQAAPAPSLEQHQQEQPAFAEIAEDDGELPF